MELYRSFLAVRRKEAYRRCRTLGLRRTNPVSRIFAPWIRRLAPLFTRSQNGLRPTDAANTLEPHAQAMAGAAAALIREISGKDFGAHAVIRIAASEIVGTEVLPPILAEFRAGHPGVVMELSLSDRTEDLLRRDADIAVRMVRPKQGSLIAKRVGTVTVGLHAHRRYLEEHGQPNNIQQLARHVLIGFDRETASIRALQRPGPETDARRFYVSNG